MSTLPQNPSESTRRMNPHLWPAFYAAGIAAAGLAGAARESNPGKRMRQSSKPLMNKLETDFLQFLYSSGKYPPESIHAQAATFRLANGLRYTPDFTHFVPYSFTAWEVKGPWVDGDSFPKLKMAAGVFPEISWRLAWKDKNGRWNEQIILP